MKQYLSLLQEVLNNGTQQPNRTGIDTLSIPGAMMKFDLADGFPAVTTKKLAFKSMVGELVAFLRGADSAEQFRNLGCGFWDQNANENKAWLNNPNRVGRPDYLGRVYGVQWRSWKKHNLVLTGGNADGTKNYKGQIEEIDQVMGALNTIHNDPNNRRIIVNAWRPDEFDQMALPPCHVLYQFLVNVPKREISLCMYQRSCDLFLGVPMNVASAALFLSIVGRLTGYTPRHFTHFLADAHIYVNHLDQIQEQLSRAPRALPKLVFVNDRVPEFHKDGFHPEWIDLIEPMDFALDGYDPHPAIKAPMAV
ncbi:MAG: thymidylate synthase [Proteobacteria bacterium]|nr:thymidylate synthase [Pseudomonadota bacterium]